ncbi:HYC_CC_PP family protein [Maribacter sp. 2304DJ31-5]|uniref:HYC_CC_PP family protein n=1 Tax=Maribacter sp. 2304DJ31-5 TaxID=3386273 RepID=UPI0039BCE557
MKEGFRKIWSIAMALLILASTVSWRIEKHYCMGHLVDVALFSAPETCGMDTSLLEDGEVMDVTKSSCCSEETILLEGQDDMQLSFQDISLEKQQFLFAFSRSFIKNIALETKRNVPLKHYPPPILIKDIQLLDEVFII